MRKMMKRIAALALAGCMMLGGGVNAMAAAGPGQAIAKGIDVSKYQGLIDWNQVAASGHSFAFIKLGSTKNGVDPFFDYNIRAAQAAGVKTGVYLYSYAQSVEEAAGEAALMVSLLEPYIVNMPVVLDVEDRTQSGLDTGTLQMMCYTFYQVLDAAGYYPIIYSNKNWFEKKIGNIMMDKWVAQWGAQLDYAGPAAFWQSSETGTVPGIGGYVDLDYQFKDLSGVIIPAGLLPRADGNVRYYANYKMQRGWINAPEGKYLADPLGNLVRGFYADETGTYYFDPLTCQAAMGLVQVAENTYYFNENGLMQTGILPLGDDVFFFDRATGAMAKGLIPDVDGNFYYAGTDGKLQSGFVEVDGVMFFFDPASLAMVRNTVIPGEGLNYVIDETGVVTMVPIIPEVPEIVPVPELPAAGTAAADAAAVEQAAAAGEVSVAQ